MLNDSVLIIEDSGFFVRGYSKVLSEVGYQVLIACDGQSGIHVAQLVVLARFMHEGFIGSLRRDAVAAIAWMAA